MEIKRRPSILLIAHIQLYTRNVFIDLSGLEIVLLPISSTSDEHIIARGLYLAQQGLESVGTEHRVVVLEGGAPPEAELDCGVVLPEEFGVARALEGHGGADEEVVVRVVVVGEELV